jgi:hypothetical protein
MKHTYHNKNPQSCKLFHNHKFFCFLFFHSPLYFPPHILQVFSPLILGWLYLQISFSFFVAIVTPRHHTISYRLPTFTINHIIHHTFVFSSQAHQQQVRCDEVVLGLCLISYSQSFYYDSK